jgi:hypothetical protein
VVGAVVRLVAVTVCNVTVRPGDQAKKDEDSHGDDTGYEGWEWKLAGAFGEGDDLVHDSPCYYQTSLGAHVARTTYLPLCAGQFLQPHWSSGVQLLGADANLGTETELAAIGEAGRGIHHDHCGVNLV